MTNDVPPEKPGHKPPVTKYTICLTMLACIGGLLFGYDTGIMSGVQLFFTKSPGMKPVTTLWVELIVSITPGIAAVGALAAGKASDSLGRKKIIVAASGAFLVGSIICSIAPDKYTILFGRAVLGVAIGFASMIIPVYISEAAPTHLRGSLVTCYQLMIATGFILANAVAAAFAHIDPVNIGWRLMFGFAAIPSILQLIGFMFLKDTPRYLYMQGRADEAEAVLTKVYGGDEAWVAYDLSVIAEVDKKEKEMKSSDDGELTLLRCIYTPHVRKALLIGCSMQMFQQFVGINSILYYTSEIIKGAGIKDDIQNLWISCGIAAVQSVGTFIPMKLIEKWGRRPTLLTSMGLMIISLFAMGMAFLVISSDTAPNNPWESLRNIGEFSNDAPYFQHCALMKNCDACVTSPHCGFCHNKANESEGTCRPVNENDDAFSMTGLCEKAMNRSDYVFSLKTCATKYTWMPIVFMVFYLLSFAFGVGALPWVYNAEIYPLWARSTCVALSTFTNWIFNLLVSMTFLTLGQTLSKGGSFFVYAVISGIGLVVFWFFVPETKGLSIEEIENLFKSDEQLEKEAEEEGEEEEEEEDDEATLETVESSVEMSAADRLRAKRRQNRLKRLEKIIEETTSEMERELAKVDLSAVPKHALEEGTIDCEPTTSDVMSTSDIISG